jgi:hypothetical protein
VMPAVKRPPLGLVPAILCGFRYRPANTSPSA